MRGTLVEIKRRIEEFDAECAESMTTDTGEVWFLLNLFVKWIDEELEKEQA